MLAQAYSPEVEQLIQELGIDPEYERPLVWIIEVGLQSPLPPKYEVSVDGETGFTYYIDNDTQQSQWENPLLPYIMQVIDIARMYIENPYQYVITQEVDAPTPTNPRVKISVWCLRFLYNCGRSRTRVFGRAGVEDVWTQQDLWHGWGSWGTIWVAGGGTGTI